VTLEHWMFFSMLFNAWLLGVGPVPLRHSRFWLGKKMTLAKIKQERMWLGV